MLSNRYQIEMFCTNFLKLRNNNIFGGFISTDSTGRHDKVKIKLKECIP